MVTDVSSELKGRSFRAKKKVLKPSILKVAEIFTVNINSYNKNKKSSKSNSKLEEDNMLKDKINNIFIASRDTYGILRITKKLKDDNLIVNHKRVQRLMDEMNLKPKAKKKFRITTDSNHEESISENILNRDFKKDKPNEAWVGDITYILTLQGWLYLAVVIDLYSRKVIGYSIQDNMKTSLIINALDMAQKNRNFPKNVLFHSDRGSQYASKLYRNKLSKYNMIQSMSRKGNCWDNAPSESFFHTLKVEEVYPKQIYATKTEARACIFDYINVFYNRQRIHSTLNYMSPVIFEIANLNRLAA